MPPYELRVSPEAREMLAEIKDVRQREQVERKMEKLANHPKLLGKPLRHDLSGFLRCRMGRYRIVYRVLEEENIVRIYGVGMREDGSLDGIYARIEQILDL